MAALAGSSGTRAAAPEPTTSTANASSSVEPAQADVAAARACAAFKTYLADAAQGRVPRAVGQSVTDNAYQLMAGASQAQTAGKPLPKWTGLGEELIAATDDVVKLDSSALAKDGAAAAEACQTIPPAAQVAGGYAASNPSPAPSS